MTVAEELKYNLYYQLVMQSPVLSGNMQMMISALGLNGLDPMNNEERILITAPSYDDKKWRKEGVIVHTYKYDYANTVNEVGAFGSHNKSEHWVNRVINEVCDEIARKYNGKVEGYLEW